MTNRFDIVAAFADGESVAAADLTTALAHDDARAYLIDVLALRGLATGAAGAGLTPSSLPASGGRRGWPALRLTLAAAAALVVVGTASGFVVGRNTSQRQALAQQLEAGSSPMEAGSSDPADRSATAPAPTHVIRIENGVLWNERAGGN